MTSELVSMACRTTVCSLASLEEEAPPAPFTSIPTLSSPLSTGTSIQKVSLNGKPTYVIVDLSQKDVANTAPHMQSITKVTVKKLDEVQRASSLSPGSAQSDEFMPSFSDTPQKLSATVIVFIPRKPSDQKGSAKK